MKLTAMFVVLVFVTSLLPMAAMGLSLKETVSSKGIDLTQKIVFQVENTAMLNEENELVMDVAPHINKDRTMVPVRYFGETIGADVNWDAKTNKITLDLTDGTSFDVTKAVTIKDNRSFLPLNLLRVKLGMTVDWIEGERLIVIHKDTLNIPEPGKLKIWEAEDQTAGKDEATEYKPFLF